MGAVEIINTLAAARRAVQLYPPEHPTHREAVDELVAAVNEAVDVRPLVLNVRNGRLHEGSEVITTNTPTTRAFAHTLETRRVESLTFHVGFSRVDATGLSEALSLRVTPELQVQTELDARDVRAVVVAELEDRSSEMAQERDRRREADRALYRHTIAGLKDITTALAEGTPADPIVAVRALGELIDRAAEDPHAILALASMTGHGERIRFHSVSVMLHAVVLGGGLGFSDKELRALGLAGLLHDIGKSLLPGDEAASYQSHPLIGAQALGAVPDDEFASMLVALEHHMGADGSGFPARPDDYALHPYSRIVAVVNRYDNLLRPADGQPMTPDQAAAHLLREAGAGPLDPVLTALFVALIGVLPVTTIVRLSDFSIGIVREPGEEPLRPHIRIVTGPDGAEIKPALDVHLVEDGRAIVEVIPEEILGMRPSDYL